MSDSTAKQRNMVERQLRARGIRDERVLAAMEKVPRHAFVPPPLVEFAYDDAPLPLQSGQTISQPYIVAMMAQAARLQRSDRVLDIGTGSGYAAAVLAELADRIDSVERLPELAEQARATLGSLGYERICVHIGDGTLGWPDAAPFDAILAAAAGPDVPEAWRQQLAIGGRIVMPVGRSRAGQRLVRVTRVGRDEFDEEDLGGVAFVPLVGEQGWPDPSAGDETAARKNDTPAHPDDDTDGPAPPAAAAASAGSPPSRAGRKRRPAASGGDIPPDALSDAIWEAAEALPDIDDALFAPLFDRFADKRVVLLGEASHGTTDFYRARAAITRRLVEAHGFDIVAVEADWPDAAAIDRHVRHRPHAPREEAPFRRFPTWMWRNTDVDAFVEWLHAYNGVLEPGERAGFYGLDLYSMSASIAAVLSYLDRTDPEAASVARERYGCLMPWQKDPRVYARAVASQGFRRCEEAVLGQLRDLLDKRLDYALRDGDNFLDAAQNARLVASAERYYRTLYQGPAQSWNLRDTHMFETLAHLLEARGPASRAVVWAHNSHIGDASATEMGRVRDEINIGQLCRERYGSEAALVGFGTYAGTVAAAEDWDGPMRLMRVRPARPDSYEHIMHRTGQPRFLLDLRPGVHDTLRALLEEPRLQRYIGVIYRPDTELYSHYAEASLSRQYDAYVWFDETAAVTPLPTQPRAGMPETYPFAV
ncbi:protein-L-isoaspartate(D-aspartate) O-methyltransferase [Bordetella bronchialis]|uniref:Protein-L-isoaspartate O-methyltransferase n=1 Tax=Bordetella bronchialis TaxID=463025 RepID=A0A193FTE0_9BORD|nr:protein-L-isoaspartate(D-aspartate) O-methyltransferase [Bordetella bronchialis]ANN70593.1 protein-L-isoaspartate O-methyltransferase [Bordetella bronchialis]